jgi:hypothetical protein
MKLPINAVMTPYSALSNLRLRGKFGKAKSEWGEIKEGPSGKGVIYIDNKEMTLEDFIWIIRCRAAALFLAKLDIR